MVKIPKVLLTHPFELCVSGIVLLAGIQSLLRGLPLSDAVEKDVYFFMLIAWQIGAILGSIMVLLGLLLRPRARSASTIIRFHGIERAGLILSGSAAWVYCVVIFARGNGTGYAIGMLTGVGAACILRALALRQADRATVQAYESLASDAH